MIKKPTSGLNVEDTKKIERRRRIILILKLTIYAILIVILVEFVELPEEKNWYSKLVDASLFYITGHLAVALSRMIIANLYLRKHKLKRSMRSNFLLGIDQVAHVISALIFIIAALSLFNISLPQLFTGMSIVAAAIAILSKDYISNMINGLIIMFSDQLSLNDYVKIGEHKGKISDITLINIHLINDDEDLVYIPNSTVLNMDVVNFTKQPVKKTTIEFEISSDGGVDLDNLESFFNEHLREFEDYIKKGSQALKVSRINKDNLQLKYQFIFQKENREIEKQIRKILPRKVVEYYNSKRQAD